MPLFIYSADAYFLGMKTWDSPTKFLHFCLALTVSSQLLTSQLLEFPVKQDQEEVLGGLFFQIHEYTGLLALVIVSLHFLWIFISKNLRFSFYFPWNRQGYQAIRQDLRGLLALRLPDGGPGSGGLVGLVHGLGLLGVLVAASLGAAIYLSLHWLPMTHALQDILVEAHEFVAGCVVIYWFGHVGMAALHYWKGDKALFSIFSAR